MSTIAVMQPYFYPYAGYFRLMAAADVFVVLDCVQFPRRGWVHRNRLASAQGMLSWLTLPLAKASRDARISEICFAERAPETLARSARRFPTVERNSDHPLVRGMFRLDGRLVDYLERTLREASSSLGISSVLVRSSSLGLQPGLRGQQRVVAIAEAMGASCYVNAPGGRALYDPETFGRRGIELRFLPEYRGSFESVLGRLLTEEADVIRSELLSQL